MSTTEPFKRLIGHWQGTCRLWFEPDKLADDQFAMNAHNVTPEGDEAKAMETIYRR